MPPYFSPYIRRAYHFLAHGIWDADLGELGRLRREFYRTGQFFTLLVRNFRRDQILLRASSLTYTTLLAIVPLIGILLAILKGLGRHRDVMPLILDYITAQNKETIQGLQQLGENVVSYIDQTNAAAVGFISFVVVAASVGSLLRASESAFNAIWHVHRSRPFFIKLRDYTFIVVITPLMLFAGLSMKQLFSDVAVGPIVIVGDAFKALVSPYPHLENSAVLWRSSLDGIATFGITTLHLLPILLLWGLFSFIYVYAPYTKVPLGAGLLGGLFGAVVWQIAYSVYIEFQFGMVRYNRIYGALAGLIFSLLWIYISWVIVLIGAQVSHVLPSLESYRRTRRTDTPSPAARERLAARLMMHIGRRFHLGTPAMPDALALAIDAPEPLVSDILAQLERRRLVLRAATDDERTVQYLPARPVSEISLEDILMAVRADGESFRPGVDKGGDALERLLEAGEAAYRESLRRTRLADLIAETPPSARPLGSTPSGEPHAAEPARDFVTARGAADAPSRLPA